MTRYENMKQDILRQAKEAGMNLPERDLTGDEFGQLHISEQILWGHMILCEAEISALDADKIKAILIAMQELYGFPPSMLTAAAALAVYSIDHMDHEIELAEKEEAYAMIEKIMNGEMEQ